ncbi:OmpH family outer membrane protein [Symmachiella dynata]|uniref:OmpH family outer membrane protein n=1 Tax=Symmachiella dynata TaxID=2527995 RepID=UPI0030EBC7B6
MTKTRLIFAVTMALIGASLIFSQAYAQGNSGESGNKVGLIDMEEVFKNYKKFTVLQEELQADMEKSKAELEGSFKRLQAAERQLKDSTFKKDSDNYTALESRFTTEKAAFEAKVQNKDRQFKRRQAEIYKTIHGEVQDIVQVFATRKGYSLVMRFRRPKSIDSDPRSIAADLNSSVVFHRDADDITDIITSALNRHFDQTAGTAPKRDSKVRTVSGQKPATSRTPTRTRSNP